MFAQKSSTITGRFDRGFTLIELLVSVVISAVLLAGFTAFYLSEQKAIRHHQSEIEASQDLRTALEQVTRDLRATGKNLTNPCSPLDNFVAAESSRVEFQLDANDDGGITTTDRDERKGYRLVAGNLEQYDAATGTWVPLASGITTFNLTYRSCNGSVLTAPVSPPGHAIASVDVAMTVSRPVVGGLPVTRTEAESVRLRNVLCGAISCP